MKTHEKVDIKSVNDPKLLANWIRSRSGLLIFVTGPTGCGKSTIVSNLSHDLGVTGIHPGRAIRSNPRMMQILAQSNNPSAPRETENFVRNYVLDRIKVSCDEVDIVDGIPRNKEQVTWCVDTALDYRRDLVFVFVHVPYNIRKQRLLGRHQEGDKELLHRRLEHDDKIMPDIMERARHVVEDGKFGYFFEINNKCTNKETTKGGIDGIAEC